MATVYIFSSSFTASIRDNDMYIILLLHVLRPSISYSNRLIHGVHNVYINRRRYNNDNNK
jgi:hypothetical protein